ncbi:MAG: immunoglobulin domain-containing protein [Chitinophagales bacterium]|nr:immunoglobulin domain-containing protein [Chitinophagales bacterium]
MNTSIYSTYKTKATALFIALAAFVFSARAQTPAWASSIGSNTNDNLNNLVTDAAGNVYATGNFQATTNDFDPGAGTLSLPIYGNVDCYIYKADANGNVLWAKSIGGAGIDIGKGIAVDANGNVIVCGYFNSTADFDPGAGTFYLTSVGNNDAFVLKLDANGNFLWATGVGSTGNDVANDVTTDASGNVYYSGSFTGNCDFDPGAGVYVQASPSGENAFVSKLTSAGAFVWEVPVDGFAICRAVALTTSGTDLVVGGTFTGTGDFDPNGTFNIASASAGVKPWVWKITQAAGALVWAKAFGSTSTTNDEIRDLDVDASGNIYTTGYFRNVCDFDPDAGTANMLAASSFSGFVQKLNSSGAYQWAGQFASSNTSGCFSVDVDASGNLLVGGNHLGKTDLIMSSDTFFITSNGGVSNCGFYAKLNSSGGLLSGGTLNDNFGQGAIVYGVAMSTNGTMVMGGTYLNQLDYNPTSALQQITNPNPSFLHCFIVKMDSCFVPEFSISPSTIHTCAGNSATVTLSGSVATNNYQLHKNNVAVGSAVPGTGNAMTFSTSTFNNNDSLTVVATHGACSRTMTGKGYILSGTLALDSNLLRHYRLDNNFTDDAGGVGASASAGGFIADRFGNTNFARNIAAANQGVQIPAFNTDNVTITFWVNPGFVGGGASTDFIYSSSYNNSMTSHLNMNTNTLRIGNAGWVATSAGVLQANVWQQVVYVKNGGNVTVYLNGSQILTTTNAPSITTFPITTFGTSQTGHLGGPIDDIRIYNYAFTAVQAQMSYTAPHVWAPVLGISQCLGAPLNIMDSVQTNSGISYQWFRNGNVLSGATSQLYTDPSLAANEVGNYRLRTTKGCVNALSQNTVVSLPSGGINIPNLTAWYKFDNNTADSSGNGNHATASNAITATTNRFNQANKAYSFSSGSNSSVTLPASILGNAQNKSISFWFKRSAGGVAQPLLTYQVASPGAWNAAAFIGTDNILRGWFYQGGAAPWSSGVTIDTNWHHFAITTTTNNQTAYLDGALVAVMAGGINVGTSSILRVGAGYMGAMAGVPSAGTYYFSGKIDEVRFYNATLTAGNITTIYTGEIGFTQQPQSVSVCTGQSASFTVAVNGNVTYQWQKNGSNISGATSATYNIASVAAGDVGNYTCVVTDACTGATLTSDIAVLSLGSGANISQQPQDASVCLGAAASFSVTVTGGSATYQWKKNGTNIAGATSATYNIASVGAGDAGNYVCVVTGSCGSINSDTATLTILPATSITTQPAASSVCPGSTATFTVVAAGAGTLTYQWKKNGTNLSNGGNISGATTATLGISNASASDAANYSVVVTGTCGSATSNNAALTLGVATSITTQPTAQTVCNGGTLNLSVVAAGANLTYQWKKNNVNIGGATSANYSTGASLSTAGSYTVAVSGTCGAVTSNAAVVTVNDTITITQQPQGSTVCEGSALSISVSATGASLTYQWKLNGIDIPGATSASYSTANALSAMSGSYTVAIGSSCGNKTSNAATIVVNPTTAITTQPVTQTACVGSSVTFSVVATGANLTYQWKKNNVNISGATSASYNIASAAAGDAGSYTVVVSGTCGSVTSSAATLTIVASASISQQPTNQTVCSGGTLTFSVVGTGGNNTTYQWWQNGIAISGATSATYTVSPATTVLNGSMFWVVISGSCGSVTSNSVSVTVNTATAITQQPQANVSVCVGSTLSLNVAVAGSSVTYQWKKNGSNLPGATSATYSAPVTSTAQAGNYTVAIGSACGSLNSDTAVVVVNDTVSITQQPVGATLCEGSALNLSVTATGTGLTYQWMRNSNNISGATSATYSVANALPAHSGSYTVFIANSCGNKISSAATVTVQATDTTSFSETICNGSSYVFDGNTLTASGQYSMMLQGMNGCDSVIILALTVLNKIETTVNAGICNGQSYTFNGQQLTQAGQYFDTLQTILGCDSFVTLNLAVNSFVTGSTSASICAGDSYTFNGQQLTQGGQYMDTLVSAGGCDSIVTLTLTVNQLPQPTITQNGNVLSTQVFASYQWQFNGSDISNATSQSHTANQNGNYTVAVTDANGCSAYSSVVTVTGVGIKEVSSFRSEVYPNPATTVLQVSSEEALLSIAIVDLYGRMVFTQAVNDAKQTQIDVSKMAASTYFIHLTTTNGNTAVKSFVKQ